MRESPPRNYHRAMSVALGTAGRRRNDAIVLIASQHQHHRIASHNNHISWDDSRVYAANATAQLTIAPRAAHTRSLPHPPRDPVSTASQSPPPPSQPLQPPSRTPLTRGRSTPISRHSWPDTRTGPAGEGFSTVLLRCSPYWAGSSSSLFTAQA